MKTEKNNIDSFDRAMEVADARKITVIMHLPKAPEYYLKELQYYNSKYPRIKLAIGSLRKFIPS